MFQKFEHPLGIIEVDVEPYELTLNFKGMWSYLCLKITDADGWGIDGLLECLSGEPSVSMVETFLWRELEKVAEKYVAAIQSHTMLSPSDEVFVVPAETPGLIASTRQSVEMRVVGRNHDSFAMWVSPTGYVGVDGRLTSSAEAHGVAHVQRDILSWDWLHATRPNGLGLSAIKADSVRTRLNGMFASLAAADTGLIASLVEARQRLLTQAEAEWPSLIQRIEAAVTNHRRSINLTDCDLDRKLSALNVDIVIPSQWPQGRPSIRP